MHSSISYGFSGHKWLQTEQPAGFFLRNFADKKKLPMTRLLTTLPILMLAALLTGCQLLESHPYDVDIDGETSLTYKNIELIEANTAGRTSLRFAMISDTQGWYDDTVDAVEAINSLGVDFTLHGGDLSDYGMAKEFMHQRDILNGLNSPYVCVIGNHDCLATGKESYQTVFGPYNFAFTAGDVRFICLNTNALEYDYSEPVPDFGFIEGELESFPAHASRTVFLMHVKPFEMVFNNNVAKVFEHYVTSFPGVQFCLYGHEHSFAADDLFGDGVMYYQCPNIGKRQFLLFNINDDNTYSYELQEF